jgi:hypothetical protein
VARDRLTDATRAHLAYMVKQNLTTAKQQLRTLRADGVMSQTLYDAQESLQNTVEDVVELEKELFKHDGS